MSREASARAARRSLLFDNLDVQLLHRRLTTAALNTLEGMREEAYRYAVSMEQAEQWHLLWKHALPNVAMYNQFVQRSMAKAALDQAPELEGALKRAFEVYCKQYFGRDVHDNVNIIQGTVPPFSEFYHCFLTRLCAEAAVVRLQVFDSHDLLQRAVKNAIVDALRDTSVDRVHILETLTEEEYRESRRRARRASRSRSRGRRTDTGGKSGAEDASSRRSGGEQIDTAGRDEAERSRRSDRGEGDGRRSDRDEGDHSRRSDRDEGDHSRRSDRDEKNGARSGGGHSRRSDRDEGDHSRRSDRDEEGGGGDHSRRSDRDEEGGGGGHSRRSDRDEGDHSRREDSSRRQDVAPKPGAFVLNDIKASSSTPHGLEWQRNLDATCRAAHVGALGPDDSASSLHSVGMRFQAEGGVVAAAAVVTPSPPHTIAPSPPPAAASTASNVRRIDMSMLPMGGGGAGVGVEPEGYVETPRPPRPAAPYSDAPQ
jgi:hypothetical protein